MAREIDAAERALFLEAFETGTVVDKDRDAAEPTPHEGHRPRKVKRRDRRLEVEERLDLHGYTVDEALVRLAAFIAAALGQRVRYVLIITGKGQRSKGGVAVLRQAIERWLRGPGASMIESYSDAPRELGGRGAWLVELRRRKRPRRS
ncbi:MAG: Smr/MutS family protein [Acidobacteriota bacterium]